MTFWRRKSHNVCIYHDADLDGLCSAAIVKHYHNQLGETLELYGMDYGYPDLPPVTERTTLFMVDFSLEPFNRMLLLRDKVRRFVWVDHHKTSKHSADNYGVQLEGMQVIDKPAACVLTWKFLFPDTLVPRGVHLLGDYDVWDHSDPDVLPWQFGMWSMNPQPHADVWQTVFAPNWDKQGAHGDILNRGVAIEQYVTLQNAKFASLKCHTVTFGGYTWLAANHGPSSSSFFDSVRDQPVDGYVLYWFNGAQWKLSLRTNRPDVDVSVVAKHYGGGGHAKAAACRVDRLPW